MHLPNNFRLRLGYFLLGGFLGLVTFFTQVKPVEAFAFPSVADIPSLIRLIPFPNILPLDPLPTIKPLKSFQNPFVSPTPTPTEIPTPTLTPIPTETPTLTPTETPTPTPTLTPIPTETLTPTLTPTITSTPPESSHLVINEVFPGGLSPTEWVELFNPTSDPIDVSGWNLFDNSTSDPLPTVSPIPAGGYAVIVGNGSTVTVPVSAVKIELSSAIGGGLAVSGDRMEMKDTANITVDALSWGSDSTFFSSPPSAPVLGESLVRLPNGSDTDTASDWSSSSSPSTGIAN